MRVQKVIKEKGLNIKCDREMTTFGQVDVTYSFRSRVGSGNGKTFNNCDVIYEGDNKSSVSW